MTRAAFLTRIRRPGRASRIFHGMLALVLAVAGSARPTAGQVRSQQLAADPAAVPRIDSPLDRPVSVSVRNTRLGAVLEEIDRQAKLDLTYTSRIVPVERQVSVDLFNSTARDALEQVLRGVGVVPIVTAAGVVALVRARDTRPAPSSRHLALGGEITGRVMDARTRRPLPGVRIVAGGQAGATVSDSAGEFRIVQVPAGPATLDLTYGGFRSDPLYVNVRAGGSSRVDVRMELAAVKVDGITVEGHRGGQLRSIRDQRTSATVVNVVSADDIGSLPDGNVAEAVQRAAGIYVQTDRGEGRFVSIRGTEPRLNSVTLNGQTLASTAATRATQLDLLPADMVASATVIKAITPDMDGTGVGGSIDIRTLSAFDRRDPFAFGSVEGMHHLQQVNYLDDKLPFAASITTGRRFGRGRAWGIALAASASRRDFGVSVLDPDGWEPSEAGYIVPQELELQVEDNERTRYGLNVGLDWRPDPGTSLSLRGLYTHTREITSNSEYEFGFEGELLEATSAGGRYTEGSAELDLSEHNNTSSLAALTLMGEHRLSDAFTWSYAGTVTGGTRDAIEPDVTFETVDPVRASGRLDLSSYFFRIQPHDQAFLSDPASYALRNAYYNVQRHRETTPTASTDLRWASHIGAAPVHLQIGAKIKVRHKTIDREQDQYRPGAMLTTLAPFALPTTGPVQGGREAWVHGDTRAFSDFFLANRHRPELFARDDFLSTLRSAERDANNRVQVLAGYLMGGVELGRLSILTGARVEHTSTRSTRAEVFVNRVARQSTLEDRTFDRDYVNLLPALLLRLAAAPELVVRAGLTHSIGRPDYAELSGSRRVEYQPTRTPGSYEGSVREGNPGLRPYESMNLDTSVEYYLSAGGLLSAAGFFKRVDHPIYELLLSRRGVVYEGLLYEELEVRQAANGDAATLRGLELTYSQPFFFLPRPLDGLGVTGNLAFIGSRVSIPGRAGEILPLFGQAGRIANLIPYYQRGPWELRAAWAHHGPYLITVGESAIEDRYIGARTTLDLSGRYSLPGHPIDLFAQARNVTNEPEVGYQGVESRYDLHVLTGRTFTVGVRAKL